MTIGAGTWRLVGYADAEGGGPRVVAPGVEATAAFADGRVSGSTGCNRYHGTATVDGGAVAVGEVATTMMACPPPASDVEAAFLRALARVASWTGDDEEVVLRAADGRPLLWFVPLVATPLVGTTWQATGINNGRGGVASVVGASVVTAVFDEGGRVAGGTGCNRFTGPYAVDGERMTVGPLATTRRACLDEAVGAQEEAFLAALGRVATFAIEGDRLRLRDADGALQADFRAGPATAADEGNPAR